MKHDINFYFGKDPVSLFSRCWQGLKRGVPIKYIPAHTDRVSRDGYKITAEFFGGVKEKKANTPDAIFRYKKMTAVYSDRIDLENKRQLGKKYDLYAFLRIFIVTSFIYLISILLWFGLLIFTLPFLKKLSKNTIYCSESNILAFFISIGLFGSLEGIFDKCLPFDLYHLLANSPDWERVK